EERLERGGGRERKRRRHGAHRGGVHDKRAREDRGPDTVAERQERTHRNASRRPDRRRARVNERQRQAELASNDVQAEEPGQDERISSIDEHRSAACPRRGWVW